MTRRPEGTRARPGPSRRLLLTGALAAATTACTGRSETSTSGRTAIAGGEPGGTFVKLARLLGTQLTEQGVTGSTTVLPSNGSLENLGLLASGEADLAPALADAVVTQGGGTLTAVARISQIALHCLVRADGPITSLEQLSGRVVAVGPRRSGTAFSARRLFRAAGLVDDRAPSRLVLATPADAVVSLAGGTIDAMFWWGGRPATEILSVAAVRPLRALDLGAHVAPANLLADSVYQTVRLPGAVYGRTDVSTLAVPVHLMCRADLSPETVAGVVDVVISSGRLLVPQPSDGVQYYAPPTLYDTSPVALHPAAAQRYRERHG